MPLCKREGDTTSRSQLSGVETTYDSCMERVVDFNIFFGGFDFVVAPLMEPHYRPSLSQKYNFGSFAELLRLPYAKSDLTLGPSLWHCHVVGKISTWIDLDSEDESLRMDSETVLKQEIAWASYLSLDACLLPIPKGTTCANYARCVNQILQGPIDMQLWLRIPLGKRDEDSSGSSGSLVDYWKTWNSFRLLCDHHKQLFVALDNLSILPSDNSLNRWYGEPITAFIIHANSFLTKDRSNHKYLSEDLQRLITYFSDHSTQIIISGEQVHSKASEENPYDTRSAADSRMHPLRPYLDYVSSLYQRMDPLINASSVYYRYTLKDVLQPCKQPFKHNFEALRYEAYEENEGKYKEYERAIRQALLDRVPDEKASEITTVLVVVGAGRGPLVLASVEAAIKTGRKLKVYAVEKNPNALGCLHILIAVNDLKAIVTIVASDVRYWNAPETADILVSEMLGSFGDSELSPECLDGAQRFLKEDGISIPNSYTSFLQPVTTSNLCNNVKEKEDILCFEIAFNVKMHNVARLAPSQPVFTFIHPKQSNNESNRRYKKLQFVIPDDTESAMVHGFAGYFDATLYKDMHIGTESSKASPDVFSWLEMFFPLRTPICVHGGSTLEVHFWRCYDSTKVWYEWCLTSPSLSPIYNCNGRAFWLGL